MITLSICSTAVGARGAAAIVETDQVVDISLSVCVTGRYAVIDVANRLAVADRKSTGIVSEPSIAAQTAVQSIASFIGFS